MTNALTPLFQLLRVAIGTETKFVLPRDTDWAKVIDLSFDQGVPALTADGVQTVYDKRPVQPAIEALEAPEIEMFKFEWFGEVMHCELENEKFTKLSKKALKYFREAGFKCCILKGSGLGLLYDEPGHRATGDIDVWLVGGRKKIFDFARSADPEGLLHGVNYHHIHFHLFGETLVEGHVYPSWFCNPFLNRKWLKFCEMYTPDNTADVPPLAFNRVYVLLHIFHHYSGHGINLKQMVDYHYVLRQGFTEEERAEAIMWLKKLRLLKFAAAMMWVQRECLGLADEFLLLPPDEKEGRYLLEELMRPCTPIASTPLRRFWGNLRRSLKVALRYPHEALWEPIFGVWLYVWRLVKGYLKDRKQN